MELVTNPSMDSERQAAHPTSNIATSNVTTLGAEIAVTNTTQSKAHQTCAPGNAISIVLDEHGQSMDAAVTAVHSGVQQAVSVNEVLPRAL